MTQSVVIENTISTLSKLPVEKAEEVADFADFVLKRHEESLLEPSNTKVVGNEYNSAFPQSLGMPTNEDVSDEEVLSVWADRKESAQEIARKLRERNRQTK